MNRENLKFFNSLSGRLEIQLSQPAQAVAGLSNLVATPEAKVTDLRLTLQVFLYEEKTFRALTEAELNLPVLQLPEISLCTESGEIVTLPAPDGQTFTVQDLQRAIETSERQTRDQSEWLGGVDVHHAYFEGLHEDEPGIWEVYWGS